MNRLINILIQLIKSLIKIISVLIILVVGIYIFGIISNSDNGKDWCINTISDYKTNPEMFQNTNTGVVTDNYISFYPTHEHKGVMGVFTVDETGEYKCSYSHGGMSKPHRYEYTSNNQKWVKVD